MRGDYRWCWSVSPQAVMEPAKRIRKTVFIGGPDHSFVECLYGRLAGGGVACPCYQRYAYRQYLFLSSDTKIDWIEVIVVKLLTAHFM